MVELAEVGVDAAEVVFDFVEAGVHLCAQFSGVIAIEQHAGEDRDEWNSDGDHIVHARSPVALPYTKVDANGGLVGGPLDL